MQLVLEYAKFGGKALKLRNSSNYRKQLCVLVDISSESVSHRYVKYGDTSAAGELLLALECDLPKRSEC